MPLLRYGFRPFFLGAGLIAALLIPWWAASYAFGIPLGTNWPPTLWHGHEMLFGFIVADVKRGARQYDKHSLHPRHTCCLPHCSPASSSPRPMQS